jgi:diguanylate cyclase (GGDEF)-like protein
MGSRFKGTRHSGKVIFNNRRSVVECEVCELSDYGACVELKNADAIPARFDLLILGESATHACAVRDRADNQLHVVFSSAPEWQKAGTGFGRRRADQELPAATALESERTALDEAEFGLVVLDTKQRVTFCNRTFRAMWSIDDASYDGISLRDLLQRASAGERASAASLRAYISDILDHVDTGNSAAIDMRLDGGEVMRFHCMLMPGTRRMLTFTPVTDLTRRVDDLKLLHDAIDHVDQGIVIMDRHLVVQFANKKARALWQLTADQCDHKPTFSQFLYDIAATGIYDQPESKLEDYVMRRFTMVQTGDQTPMDVPIRGNRVIRAQCTVLPCGGRMLTHTDVTDLVSLARHNERLANLDALTGLPNRRFFAESAEAEWDRFIRYGRPFALLAVDLDGLKQINDSFGHDTGDAAIRKIAEICDKEKRTSDTVARLSGDEFAILMPCTGEDEAQRFAERLCEQIAATRLPHSGSISISVGLAEAKPSMSDFSELAKLADERLYAAKRSGRNRAAAEAPRAADKGSSRNQASS